MTRELHSEDFISGAKDAVIGTFPRLYAIIDRETLNARELNVIEFAKELRDGGVRLVQYRDKIGSSREILQACAEIRAVFDGTEATLILNDRADLAILAGWDGVHVGQGDLPIGAARKVLEGQGPATLVGRKLVGLSTHDDAQVRSATADNLAGREPDYVAIGPVFATSSKANPEPVVGLDGVRRARALTSKPLAAIGGITIENAAKVIEAGADSVAVIGGLLQGERTVAELAREFLKRLP